VTWTDGHKAPVTAQEALLVIQLTDFNLRGGQDAATAAVRAARVVRRHVSDSRADDTMAVVNEVVTWLARGDPIPHSLHLEISVTGSVVRVSVTAAQRSVIDDRIASNEVLRRTLPVTAALATRYGLEVTRRTRVWAEFDRQPDTAPV
jgi:hypothetical protein